MASIRYRSNKRQARVSHKGEQSLANTFRSKEVDIELALAIDSIARK